MGVASCGREGEDVGIKSQCDVTPVAGYQSRWAGASHAGVPILLAQLECVFLVRAVGRGSPDLVVSLNFCSTVGGGLSQLWLSMMTSAASRSVSARNRDGTRIDGRRGYRGRQCISSPTDGRNGEESQHPAVFGTGRDEVALVICTQSWKCMCMCMWSSTGTPFVSNCFIDASAYDASSRATSPRHRVVQSCQYSWMISESGSPGSSLPNHVRCPDPFRHLPAIM